MSDNVSCQNRTDVKNPVFSAKEPKRHYTFGACLHPIFDSEIL